MNSAHKKVATATSTSVMADDATISTTLRKASAATDLRRLREKCDLVKALCQVAKGRILLGNHDDAIAAIDKIETAINWFER